MLDDQISFEGISEFSQITSVIKTLPICAYTVAVLTKMAKIIFKNKKQSQNIIFPIYILFYQCKHIYLPFFARLVVENVKYHNLYIARFASKTHFYRVGQNDHPIPSYSLAVLQMQEYFQINVFTIYFSLKIPFPETVFYQTLPDPQSV